MMHLNLCRSFVLKRIPGKLRSLDSAKYSMRGISSFQERRPCRNLRPIQRAHQTQIRLLSRTCLSLSTSQRDRAAFDEKALLYSNYELAQPVPMSGFDHEPSSEMVVVQWDDGDSQQFPILWLRDNCHCPSCYNLDAHTRMKYIQDLNLDVRVKNITISDDSQMLNVTWCDDHKTSFPSNWLKCNRFDQSGVDSVVNAQTEFWGSDVMSSGRLRTFKFTDLMTCDVALHDWLMEIMVLGITMVKDTPVKSHQIHKLADRIGHMLPTTFGNYVDVVAVQDSDNIAFMSGFLQPHTDYSFYMTAPAVGLFHCIVQADGDGGENQLIDTFKAVKELEMTDPEAFKILTTREIEYFALAENKEITAKGFYHWSRHPLIRLDTDGNVVQVVTGDYSRSSICRVPVEEVPRFYRAFSAFNDILRREDNVFNYKLKPGDILCFNNSRMLHGRTAYELSTQKQNGVGRHLQSCYFDMDCVMSRIRILKNRAMQKKCTT